jgi:hypothetical protein
MTIFEPCILLAGVGSAIAGGIAGAQEGFFWGVGGTLAGGLAGVVATCAVVAATGCIAIVGMKFEKPVAEAQGSPPAKRSAFYELGFLLVISPIVLAPVWTPLLVYRIVSMAVGTG